MNKVESLMEFIMTDWEWWHDDRHECKFCGVRQNTPQTEVHAEVCPRLNWAIKNKDTPAQRVSRKMGRDYTKTWGQPDWKLIRSSQLSSDGRKLKEIMEIKDE